MRVSRVAPMLTLMSGPIPRSARDDTQREMAPARDDTCDLPHGPSYQPFAFSKLVRPGLCSHSGRRTGAYLPTGWEGAWR
jgi:hypothetical protein